MCCGITLRELIVLPRLLTGFVGGKKSMEERGGKGLGRGRK